MNIFAAYHIKNAKPGQREPAIQQLAGRHERADLIRLVFHDTDTSDTVHVYTDRPDQFASTTFEQAADYVTDKTPQPLTAFGRLNNDFFAVVDLSLR